MRTIGVVTVGRSDYGIYLPLLRKIQADPDLHLHLIVAGAHLSPEFGLTVNEIEADGFEIGQRVEMLLSSDTPEGIAKSMGLGTIGFAEAYQRFPPDILLVLGDRFEMHSAVVAAVPFLLPIAHIAGGVVTKGAIDDGFRHSITKMSHLHFTETDTYSSRVIGMGEEPWRVTTTGALAMDNLRQLPVLSREELDLQFGLSLDTRPLLVTFHPVTRNYQDTESHIEELLAALAQVDLPVVFTYPNADTNGRTIIRAIETYASNHKHAKALKNMGVTGYMSLMRHAEAMVGNSSSGIVESPAFKLPVVNIGDRQCGRVMVKNVITVGYSRDEIAGGINKAISQEFRRQLDDLQNLYGDGHAAARMIDQLKNVRLDHALLKKDFYVPKSDSVIPECGAKG